MTIEWESDTRCVWKAGGMGVGAWITWGMPDHSKELGFCSSGTEKLLKNFNVSSDMIPFVFLKITLRGL